MLILVICSWSLENPSNSNFIDLKTEKKKSFLVYDKSEEKEKEIYGHWTESHNNILVFGLASRS